MAVIPLNIPDAVVPRVQDAVTARHGWTPGSGLTKTQFVKKYLIDILKDDVRFMEAQAAQEQHRIAGEAAAQTAIASVEVEVVIT